MDFIERFFGLSPDNGDGSTEVMWLAVIAIVVGAVVYWRRRRVGRATTFRHRQ